ncbi:MAG: alpha/beta hydrolase [Deltaproteobacteria bacterium]|nr:alpha/beta hydrolase [Deltaproteobacteria bacterium]
MHEHAIDIHEGRIRIRESGKGPALLMIHGLFVSGDVFRPIVDRLSDRFRCLAIDLPGSGRSIASLSFIPGWLSYAKAVLDTADALSLARFSLLGHSMGAGIAIVAAANAARRVEKLVLADAVSLPYNVPMKGRLLRVPGLGGLLFRCYGRGMFVNYFRHDVFRDPRAMDLDLVLRHYEILSAHRTMTLAALRITADPRPVTTAVPTVGASSLVLWGANDRLVPPDVGRRLADAIPGARLEIIPECGHSPLEEKPDESARIIGEFLAMRGKS